MAGSPVTTGSAERWCAPSSYPCELKEEVVMKKTLATLAVVAAVGATAIALPAPAEARPIGPAVGFGIAAGALTAGAIAAGAYPYYGAAYGPGYYYGPPVYYAPRYAYYGGPAYYPRRHYYYHHW
jgi:hypothetical protein